MTTFTEELLIDFRELLGEHSGENFASLVWDTLELYGLVGRVRICHFLAYTQVTHPDIPRLWLSIATTPQITTP